MTLTAIKVVAFKYLYVRCSAECRVVIICGFAAYETLCSSLETHNCKQGLEQSFMLTKSNTNPVIELGHILKKVSNMLVYTILLCFVCIGKYTNSIIMNNVFCYNRLLNCVCSVSCQDLRSLIRQSGRTAKFKCGVDGVYIINQGIHWYLQDNSKNIKWLLFYKPGKTEALDDYKTRLSLEIVSDSSCIFSITNIKPSDDGTYFCAAWHSSTFLQLHREFIQYPPSKFLYSLVYYTRMSF